MPFLNKKEKTKMKYKNVTVKDGSKIKLEIIEDISNYRGFYFIHSDGTYTKDNYNHSALNNVLLKYSRGFNIPSDIGVVQYLYEKLKKNSYLNGNELIEFYEKVDLRKPILKEDGLSYDFRSIMVKKENVQFWTIYEKFSSQEIDIYKSCPVLADELIF